MSVPPRSEADGATAADPQAPAPAGGEDPSEGAAAEDGAPAKPQRPRHEPSKHPWVWWVGLGLLLVAVAWLMFALTRGLTFNLDEWIVVTERRGPGAPSLLAPHNEHLSVLIIGTFIALLKIGGLDAFGLFMVPLVALQLGLGVLLFQIAKVRVGVGVALAVVTDRAAQRPRVRELPHTGPSRPDGIDRRRGRGVPRPRPARVQTQRPHPLRAHDRHAVLVGARHPGARGRRGRAASDAGAAAQRLWVVGVPFALYVLWYVFYGTNRAGYHDLALSALWAWTALCNAAGAMIGERQNEPGQDFLLVLLVVLAYRAFRITPRDASASPRSRPSCSCSTGSPRCRATTSRRRPRRATSRSGSSSCCSCSSRPRAAGRSARGCRTS